MRRRGGVMWAEREEMEGWGCCGLECRREGEGKRKERQKWGNVGGD